MDEALLERLVTGMFTRVLKEEAENLFRHWLGERPLDPEAVVVGALCAAEFHAPGFLEEQSRSWQRAESLAKNLVQSVTRGVGDPNLALKQQAYRTRSVVEAAHGLTRPLLLIHPEAGGRLAKLLRELGESIGGIQLVSLLALEASAQRLSGDFEGAEETLGWAANWLEREESRGDSGILLRSLALLRADQGRLSEASALFEESRRCFLDVDDVHEASASLALSAIARYEKEAGMAVLKALLTALRGLREDRSPALTHRTVLTAAHLLATAGDRRSASSLLAESWAGSDGEDRPWGLWLEGRVRWLVGEADRALENLNQAHHHFSERRLRFEHALCSWDLACVLGQRQERRRILELADGVILRNPYFRSAIPGLFLELLGRQDATSCHQSRSYLRLLLESGNLRPNPTRFA